MFLTSRGLLYGNVWITGERLVKLGVVCVSTPRKKPIKTACSARIKPYYEFRCKVALSTIQQTIGSSTSRRITVIRTTARRLRIQSTKQSATDGIRPKYAVVDRSYRSKELFQGRFRKKVSNTNT